MYSFWQVLFWTWAIGELTLAIATRTSRDAGKVQDRGTQAILIVVISFSVTLSQILQYSTSFPLFNRPISLRVFAVFLMLAGLIVRALAIANLGEAFSVNVAIRETQKLRDTGVYRFVRHPSYLGLLMIFVAVGIFSLNWVSFLVMVVPPTVALLYRIHVEEAVLSGAFGSDYAAYSRHTKRLIPGIY
jgi:protein-S-isoprenylcysteine O-methyltransferase Ste14